MSEISNEAAKSAAEADAEIAAQFPPGVLVALKSGGPVMTVSTVSHGKVWTAHWETADDYLSLRPSQRLQQRSFHPDMLVRRGS